MCVSVGLGSLGPWRDETQAADGSIAGSVLPAGRAVVVAEPRTGPRTSAVVQATLRVRMLEDRSRIAGDLQQTVIRELFSLGLSLQSTAARAGRTDIEQALTECVDDLDRIIRDVRAVVFARDRRT